MDLCVFFARWVPAAEAVNFNEFASIWELVAPKISTFFQVPKFYINFASYTPWDFICFAWIGVHFAQGTSHRSHWMSMELHACSKGYRLRIALHLFGFASTVQGAHLVRISMDFNFTMDIPRIAIDFDGFV